MDIFKDVNLDKKEDLFRNTRDENFIKYKFTKKSKLIMMNKLKFMMYLKIISGISYV